MFVYIDRIVLLFGAWDDRNMLLLEFLFGKRSGSIALNFRKQFLSDGAIEPHLVWFLFGKHSGSITPNFRKRFLFNSRHNTYCLILILARLCLLLHYLS